MPGDAGESVEQVMPRSANFDVRPPLNASWLRAVGQDFAVYLHVVSVILLGASCAWLTWSAVWMAYPRSYEAWNSARIIIAFLCAAGPIAAASFSIRALVPNCSIQSRARDFSVSVVIAVLVSLALLFVTLERLMGSESSNSWSAFLVIAGPSLVSGMAIVGAIRLVLPAHAMSWVHERVLHGLIVASVGLPFAGLLLWSVLNIALVGSRASAIAGSDPYCVQVPNDYLGREKAVARWSELAGLRMQTPITNGGGTSDYQFAFHAILIVKRDHGNEFYNWSHYTQNFVSISEHTKRSMYIRAACQPAKGFLYELDGF